MKRFVNRLKKHLNFRVRRYTDISKRRRLFWGEERESTKSNMSSTIVALVTDGEKAVWAHSGDSRLYYISKKRISQITDDHSIAFRDFKEGIITFDEIRTSPNQNKLLSSISDIDDLNFDVSEVIDLKKGDAFVLCTDGFWEYVYEDDIEKSFAKTNHRKNGLKKCSKACTKTKKKTMIITVQ